MATGAEQPVLSPDSATAKLLILDGHAYAYRAFYAIRQLGSPSGAPTNAIFGFIKMLAKLRTWLQPTHVVVAWDGGLAEERMLALPEYKAQRPPMPADLERQIEDIWHYLQAARVASRCEDGVEADDWIATVARHAVSEGAWVIIASSDKDFMQLVAPRVGLVNPNDKSETIWTRENVLTKTGVEPGQIVDWLSLVGDSVDNIPGVEGVGTKTATDLVHQFGSVSRLYESLSEVRSERLRANLLAAEPVVRRNQSLIRLNDRLPMTLTLEQCALATEDYDQLRQLYARWGFRSLLREVEAATAATAAQQELW